MLESRQECAFELRRTLLERFWQNHQDILVRWHLQRGRFESGVLYQARGGDYAACAAEGWERSGWEYRKSDFELKLEAALRLHNLTLGGVEYFLLSLQGEQLTVALVDVDYDDEHRPFLLDEREGLENEYDLMVRYLMEFAPNRVVRREVARAVRDGDLISPGDFDAELSAAALGENGRFSAVHNLGRLSGRGENFHDHRGRPMCGIDAERTRLPEDLQWGVALKGGGFYIEDHVPDSRFPNAGFRLGQEVLTFFIGFVADRDGIPQDSYFSRALTANGSLISQPDFCAGRYSTAPEVQRSLDVLVKFTAARLGEDRASSARSRTVQEIRQVTNMLFVRAFEDTGIPILCHDHRAIGEEYLPEVQKCIPQAEMADLVVGVRLGSLLLNLQQLEACELAESLVEALAARSAVAVRAPRSDEAFCGSAQFKARGLWGRINQIQAAHLLYGSPPLPRDELLGAARLLNGRAFRERMINWSAVNSRRLHEMQPMVGKRFDGMVRKVWGDGLFVDVRSAGFSGLVPPEHARGLPLDEYRRRDRIHILPVQYLGYNPFLLHAVFRPA